MNNEKPTVLITGVAGLIGSALAERLAERFRVVGFDIVDQTPSASLSAYHRVDLSSDQSVEDGIGQVRRTFGERIGSVIHLAAYYDFSGEPSPLYDEVTVRGTRRLLGALQPLEVEQFVFSSTMLVHAPCEPGEKIDEDWELEPKWDYPQSKRHTEAVIRSNRGDIPAVLARIAGVYTDTCDSIPIANQISRIYERTATSQVYPGDLERGQAFIHLDDLTDAFDRMISRRHDLNPLEVFLIGEDRTLGYGELQRRLGKLIHAEEWETRKIPKTLAKTGAWFEEKIPGSEPFIKPWMVDLADDHFELDISRARERLGWEPRRSLGETLPLMVDALEADPVGWYKHHGLEVPRELQKQEG